MKLTLTIEEPAAKIENFILCLPTDVVNQEIAAPGTTIISTLELAAEAIRFQELHRWRKLSEERPPTAGYYRVWHPGIKRATEEWFDPNAGFMDEGRLSHWQRITQPEESDDQE